MNREESAVILRQYKRHAVSWRENEESETGEEPDSLGMRQVEIRLPEEFIRELECIGREIIVKAMVCSELKKVSDNSSG